APFCRAGAASLITSRRQSWSVRAYPLRRSNRKWPNLVRGGGSGACAGATARPSLVCCGKPTQRPRRCWDGTVSRSAMSASADTPSGLDALLAHLLASRFAHPLVNRLLRCRFAMTLSGGVRLVFLRRLAIGHSILPGFRFRAYGTRDRTTCSRVASRLVDGLHLDFLNLDQALPLMRQKVVDLLVKMTDFEFRFEVHLVVVSRVQAVSDSLPDLAHHDHRSLDRRQTRQDEIQEDERVGIKRSDDQDDRIDANPEPHDHHKQDEECPTTAKSREAVRGTLT